MNDHIDSELEAGYNVRTARADYDAVLNRWVRRSEAFRASASGHLDVPYGDAARQCLDVFAADENAPTFVYLHGGYWQRGDKSIYSFIAEPYSERGVNVVVMNYTLCPETTVAGIVDEVRSGLVWLYRNSGRYRLSADRINVAGHSAGGHLVAMMLATDWRDHGDDLPTDLVKTGVPISGLYDLAPLRRTSINNAARIDDDTVRRYSPVLLSPADRATVLAVVGGGETKAFHDQLSDFVASWSAAGALAESFVEPGADHFDVVDRLADRDSGLFTAIADRLA